MRSEIACVRCAVSKIKCVNTGIDTTCRTCADRGLTCTYRPPRWSAGRSKSLVANGEDEKAELDWSLLTPAVLKELGDIFTKHFLADLAFLHVPSFLQSVAAFQEADEADRFKATGHANARSRPKSELILAFLAMTARHHPKLVRYHSTRVGKRKDVSHLASEFYAAAAARQMERSSAPGRDDVKVEDVQVRLMMALHAWTMHRGATAWIVLGDAIRTAQLLGLHHVDEPKKSISIAMSWEIECMGFHPASVLDHVDASNGIAPGFSQLEVLRKTFWSCYRMDCQFSLGRNRLRMLQPGHHKTNSTSARKWDTIEENVDVELDVDLNVHPDCLRKFRQRRMDSLVPTPAVARAQDDLAHEYTVALDCLHDIVAGQHAQQFLTDNHPPWDVRSRWHTAVRKLMRRLSFLPDHLAFTPSNLSVHNQNGQGAAYTHLHAMTNTCISFIHGVWLPFIPLHCRGAQGPLDGPTSRIAASAPSTFWSSSVRQAISSVVLTVTLLEAQMKHGELPETPLMGFLAFLTGQVTLYYLHFPWMDSEGILDVDTADPGTSGPAGEEGSQWPPPGPTRVVIEALTQIAEHSPMARQWIDCLRQLHHYFARFKVDFRANVNVACADSLYGQLSLRQGGPGGGSEEMQHMLASLRDYGELIDRSVT